MKRRSKLLHLTHTDFLEALAWLATFKRMPTADELQAQGFLAAAEYFDARERGEIGPSRFASEAEAEAEAAVAPLSWAEEEASKGPTRTFPSPPLAHPRRPPLLFLMLPRGRSGR